MMSVFRYPYDHAKLTLLLGIDNSGVSGILKVFVKY